MDDPHNNPRDERAIGPEDASTPAAAANELVVQGLLESLHRKDAATRDERVDRALNSLDPSAPFRFPRIARWGVAIAAAIAMVVGLVFIGVLGEPKALAMVQESIAAMRTVGDRRYEVSMGLREGDDPGADVNAIIDMRPPNLLLIRHKPPGATEFAVGGRDQRGEWAIATGGAVIRDNPRREWPPFVTDGGETFMTDSIDKQLAELPDQFTFAKGVPESIGAGATKFDRVTATRKVRVGMRPTRVDLWIDPASKLVERIEYRWDGVEGPGPGRRPDGPGPHGPKPPDHGDRPDGDRPPHEHDHDHGHGHGPDHPPPDHDGPGGSPDFAPGGGPDHGPNHGPDGHGPKGPGGPKMGPRGGPRLVTFQRVDAPQLPADWFTPEGHAGK